MGPKVKLSRRVGVPIADIPKHTSKRQLSPNGMHGFRGRRVKDYGIRKDEKQKLRYHYNVLESSSEAISQPRRGDRATPVRTCFSFWNVDSTTSSVVQGSPARSGRHVSSWCTATSW
jgi:hypothetical protein